MTEANARLEFLWKASHLLVSSCPSASSHYMAQFLDLANNRDLRLHEDIQTKACAACGSVFVPGVNTKVRVVPVPMTKLQRERRKKAARKKAKKEQSLAKDKDKDNMDLEASMEEGTTSMDEHEKSIGLKVESKAHTSSTPKQEALTRSSTRKVIRITSYSESTPSQQKRPFGNKNADGALGKKIDKRSNQLLNHIIYSCLRCHRNTELPGSKEGYLTTRVKTRKSVSQRRKMKQAQQVASESTTSTNSLSAPKPAATSVPQNTFKQATTPQPANVSTKRPASPLTMPNIKRPNHGSPMPSSSTTPSSSAASSPASSQRLDNNKSSANSKKKKKGGLAQLLANQKVKDSSSDPSGGAAGSGGDSVLANFLMGL
ncbi:MAG: hypothetical protein J3Q66DRAFT_329140 [Benniella sp.]|nr:MAG: hypothetical protein J3Q66DRAFT_329140 [Benniella sp.]